MKEAKLISPQWYYLYCPYCGHLHTDIMDDDDRVKGSVMECFDEATCDDGFFRQWGCGKSFKVTGWGAD